MNPFFRCLGEKFLLASNRLRNACILPMYAVLPISLILVHVLGMEVGGDLKLDRGPSGDPMNMEMDNDVIWKL